MNALLIAAGNFIDETETAFALELIPSFKKTSFFDKGNVCTVGLMVIVFFIAVADLSRVIEYIFIGIFVFWAILKVRNKDFGFIRTPLDLPILLFISWVLLTVPFAFDPSYSFTEWRKTILKFLMFYFVVNAIDDESQVKKILIAFVSGIVLMSVFGIFEHVANGGSFFDKSSHADSLAQSGQWFSSFIVMGIPFVWLFFLEGKETYTKLFVGCLFVIVLAGLFLSHTRGAWLAFLLQLILLWLMGVFNKWQRWDILKITGMFVVACGVVFMGGQYNKETQTEVSQDSPFLNLESTNIRLDTWQIAFDQLLERPIVGYGYGNHTFQKINEEVMVGTIDTPSVGMHLHNTLVSVIYGVGLIGFVLFAAILFFIMKTAIQGGHVFGDTFLGKLGFAIFLMLVGVITRNMFDNMLVGTLSYLLWLLTGLYFALWVRVRKPN